MARARNIKPSTFKNEILGTADPMLTILFQSLWCLADREGRLEDRPLRIKAETFPYREGIDINGYLTELERLKFIDRYSVDNLSIIQVVNFKKHQNPHKTEKASELPEKPIKTDGCSLTVKAPLNDVEETEPIALIPDSLNTDSLTPNLAGSVCKKLHEMQIHGVNPSHPNLQSLFEAGCTEQEIVDMAATVKVKKFAYVLSAVISAREQAAQANIVKGDFGKKSQPWFLSVKGIEEKGKEFGLEYRKDEYFPSYKARVYKKAGLTDEEYEKGKADYEGKRA